MHRNNSILYSLSTDIMESRFINEALTAHNFFRPKHGDTFIISYFFIFLNIENNQLILYLYKKT